MPLLEFRMRVNSIKLSLNNRPKVFHSDESFLNKKDGKSGEFSSPALGYKNVPYNSTLTFLGVVYPFRPKQDAYTASSRRAELLESENKPEINHPSKEILFIFLKAKEVENCLPPILDRFKSVYENASALSSSFRKKFMLDDTRIHYPKRNITLDETDDGGNVTKTAYFTDNELKMIKDFKENKTILFKNDSSDAKGKRMDVFLGCRDMEDDEIIRADEVFSFIAGNLYRYGANCEEDITCGRFYADEVFTFKRNVFECYDYSLTIACGTEYAREHIAFSVHPSIEYTNVVGNLLPTRHVENKVAAKNRIIHSGKETILTEYSEYFNTAKAEQA